MHRASSLHHKRIAFGGLIISAALLMTGCAMNEAPQNKTSLEIQAYQSRQFEADKKTAFNSAMSVFQDLGYIVNSANLDTGFITAESPIKGAQGGKLFYLFWQVCASKDEQR